MPSLRETKTRIASIKSTLKITSAMKLVASTKLHNAQKLIEGMRPYSSAFEEIMSDLKGFLLSKDYLSKVNETAPVAIVVISSNNSLCGGFNNNICKKALEIASEYESVFFYTIGRKISDFIRKNGYEYEDGYEGLLDKGNYEKSAKFAQNIVNQYLNGRFSKVVLVYNRFLSIAHQEPYSELYLPYLVSKESTDSPDENMLYEPGGQQILDELFPQLMSMRFHTAILDSLAAEHASRSLAMQIASDNAENLIADLTLEYNKARQQKITSEILDIVGGSQ